MSRISIIRTSTFAAACLALAALSATAPSAAARPANAPPVKPPGPFVSKTPGSQPLKTAPLYGLHLPRVF